MTVEEAGERVTAAVVALEDRIRSLEERARAAETRAAVAEAIAAERAVRIDDLSRTRSAEAPRGPTIDEIDRAIVAAAESLGLSRGEFLKEVAPPVALEIIDRIAAEFNIPHEIIRAKVGAWLDTAAREWLADGPHT